MGEFFFFYEGVVESIVRFNVLEFYVFCFYKGVECFYLVEDVVFCFIVSEFYIFFVEVEKVWVVWMSVNGYIIFFCEFYCFFYDEGVFCMLVCCDVC